jgi:hypothetical protein
LIQALVGEISGGELQEMCDCRWKMLDEANRQVILLADAHDLDGLTSAEPASTLCDSVIHHPNVYRTLIVLKPTLFRSVRGAVESMQPHGLPIAFYSDADAAMTEAEALCKAMR